MDNGIAASLGAGSGINVSQLVRDLASASREPKVSRINTLTQQNQARISAVAQARSDLDGLATSLAQLVSDGTLRSTATLSDDSVISASFAAGADPSSLSASVEVVTLARAQSLVSGVVTSRTAPIGLGSLTLTTGSTTTPLTIGSGNDSIDGLADAINAAGAGVRASVVADTGGFRLILKGQSGAASVFSLTADPGADPSLASVVGGITVAQTARDAEVKIDGVSFSRTSNVIADLVPGMTLTLKKASPGVPVDIGASRPTDAIRLAVGDFVSAFNDMTSNIRAAVRLSGAGAGLRQLEGELQSVANSALTSHGTIGRLADIGVSTTREGILVLDRTKLDRAIASDPSAVEALFNPKRDAAHTVSTDPGLAGILDGIRDRATQTNGVIDRATKSLESRQRSLTESLAKIEAREAAYAARLERQYGSLDSRVGSLRATQAYLDQQIEIWNNSNN